MCIDAREWTTNSRSSGLSDVVGAGIPITSPGFFRGFVRILELVKKSPNPTLLHGRIVLGSRFPHVISPRILARKDHAHEAHTFG